MNGRLITLIINEFLVSHCSDDYLDEDIFGEDEDSDYYENYDAGKWNSKTSSDHLILGKILYNT